MPGDLRVLASFPTPTEAGILRLQLEAAGIRSVLDNEGVVGMNWMLGNAVGGVKVLVVEEELEAARQVMADAAAVEPERKAGDWICLVCGKEVEGNFDFCWSCGASRDGERDAGFAAEPESADDDAPPAGSPNDEAEVQPTHEAALAAHLQAVREVANPFRSPLATADDETLVENRGAEEVEIDEADAVAYRAWRAAIIGLVYCPPLLHIYSTCLLLSLAFSDRPLSRQASRRCAAAWAINVAVSAVFGLTLASMMH